LLRRLVPGEEVMAARKKVETQDTELFRRLVEAVEAVAGELQVLRQVLDEIREDFGWGLSNNRFRCPGVRVPPIPADPTADPAPEWPPDEEPGFDGE
jgi:hypothetical protein